MRNAMAEAYWGNIIINPTAMALMRAQDNMKEVMQGMYHYTAEEADAAVGDVLKTLQIATELFEKIKNGDIKKTASMNLRCLSKNVG